GQIRQALKKANETTGKPFLIIGKTIMGKGALDEAGSSFERKTATHGMPLGEAGASFKKSIANLGGNPEDPFQVFPEVSSYYNQVKQSLVKEAANKKAKIAEWGKANPELAAKLNRFLSGETVKVDYAAIAHKENIATRAASSNVLSVYAKQVENMIVASADLSNSDKTDGFLKNTKAFRKGDFSGAFLQAGVCELTMASIANGMALHGGVIAACGTFFVFSDYMKPAVRLAALMQLPVKYVWTHDAFRVGEDGPTHQPIEQEAQIRLMEQLKNHHGDNSLLVLRPADAAETSVAWKMAMENTKTPTALLLSRQNIKDVPAKPGSVRYLDALGAEKGAYIAKDCEGKPDLILVANGSEVGTCIAGAEKLTAEKGLKVRIVSAISEGLFHNQSNQYKEEVLPSAIPTLGLTAGLPVTLKGLVGPFGKVIGLDHFGYSAPYTVLDEKFGFTAENIFNQSLDYLKNYKR
ncbi:MAG TPA: transketolase C-terminal domain-containing protein, partial [Bacteroidales bacterium]|nr:transketolase C-terminal domain-containing protein [Bacteroidales bacterium]